MKNSSNLNISCKVVFSLNKWNKKVGSPGSFGRKRSFISLNSSASIENLSRSERARARARANHAINDAQKGCAMQLNGITLILIFKYFLLKVKVVLFLYALLGLVRVITLLLIGFSASTENRFDSANFRRHYLLASSFRRRRFLQVGFAISVAEMWNFCCKRTRSAIKLYTKLGFIN